MTLFSRQALRVAATGLCVMSGCLPATAAVVASASMTVTANVTAGCAGHGCTADHARTENVVAFNSSSVTDAANPLPASAQVHRMLVVAY